MDMIVVLMGVSGSGKSTIGASLAGKMHSTFADADDYHSAANKQKMAAGHPLNDLDRQPWLETLNGLLRKWHKDGSGGVLACSALKERSRETLAAGMPEGTVKFCLLEISREVLEKRLTDRHHEFMTPTLLDSQLATLELPKNALIVKNDRPPDEVVAEILSKIQNVRNRART